MLDYAVAVGDARLLGFDYDVVGEALQVLLVLLYQLQDLWLDLPVQVPLLLREHTTIPCVLNRLCADLA